MKLAASFENLGPYHVARLKALARASTLLAVELRGQSSTYAWDPALEVPFARTTLFRAEELQRSKVARLVRSSVTKSLTDFGPDVVLAPGWSSHLSIATILWADVHKRPVILMSASQEIDAQRSPVREWVKRRIVACCDAAIVGGPTQRDYLVNLGLSAERIRFGYNVVDNDHFRVGAAAARGNAASLRQQLGLPERYFLATARFVEKKNFGRLIEAFSRLVGATQVAEKEPWHLVILGDGPLRRELEQQVASTGLQNRVLMPGFKQYADLPSYYGLAEAFVLPSTTEQWGLVVNEAMASGLPVLVSQRCGVATLVQEGENGFSFDPYDVDALTQALARTADDEGLRRTMGQASARTIASNSPQTFAASVVELAHVATRARKPLRSPLGRLVLHAMLSGLKGGHE